MIDPLGNVSAVTVDTGMIDAGHIAVAITESACRVMLAPGLVEWIAYATLIEELVDLEPDRILLQWRDETWTNEIISTITALQARLVALMMECSPEDRFRRKSRPLNLLAKSHPLAPLVELWRASGGAVDMAFHADAIDKHTNSKFMVVRQDRDNGRAQFSQFGKTDWYVYLDRNWTAKCIDRPVEMQPDFEYGNWVAAELKQAIAAGMPTATDADTYVSSGGVERRMQYTRLTLPVIGLNGMQELLSTSLRDECIDLRQSVH